MGNAYLEWCSKHALLKLELAGQVEKLLYQAAYGKDATIELIRRTAQMMREDAQQLDEMLGKMAQDLKRTDLAAMGAVWIKTMRQVASDMELHADEDTSAHPETRSDEHVQAGVNLPDWIPRFPGSYPELYTGKMDAQGVIVFSFVIRSAPKQVYKYYQSAIKQSGFEQDDSAIANDGTGMVRAQGDIKDHTLAISITPAPDIPGMPMTRVVIAFPDSPRTRLEMSNVEPVTTPTTKPEEAAGQANQKTTTQPDITEKCIIVSEITYQNQPSGVSGTIKSACDREGSVTIAIRFYDAKGDQVDLQILTKLMKPGSTAPFSIGPGGRKAESVTTGRVTDVFWGPIP